MTQTPDFKINQLIPAVIQDFYTKNVLMLGYMNEASWHQTVTTGKVTFFSRKRQAIWVKGETSGNFLDVQEISVDCDLDTILIQAIPTGPVCHTGEDTCFKKKNKGSDLGFLETTIAARRTDKENKDSYTQELFRKGSKKIAQKVGEEAVELALEAMDNNDVDFLNEAADLMYHYLVLLQSKNCTLDDVIKILNKRHINTPPTQ